MFFISLFPQHEVENIHGWIAAYFWESPMKCSALSDLEIRFEHHVVAAKYCNQAAIEHSNAAQCCATGKTDRAEDHAKNACDWCEKAQVHGKKTME